jgi:hypothetical protein
MQVVTDNYTTSFYYWVYYELFGTNVVTGKLSVHNKSILHKLSYTANRNVTIHWDTYQYINYSFLASYWFSSVSQNVSELSFS